jgi:hypothetical protein
MVNIGIKFSVVIVLDAFLQTEDAHMELCRALNKASMAASYFKVCIRKLDISCLGVPRIKVLLDEINPLVS